MYFQNFTEQTKNKLILLNEEFQGILVFVCTKSQVFVNPILDFSNNIDCDLAGGVCDKLYFEGKKIEEGFLIFGINSEKILTISKSLKIENLNFLRFYNHNDSKSILILSNLLHINHDFFISIEILTQQIFQKNNTFCFGTTQNKEALVFTNQGFLHDSFLMIILNNEFNISQHQLHF